MPTLNEAAKLILPGFLVEVIGATRRSKREAFEHSNLSILPPSFKKSPGFVIDVGANHGQWIGSVIRFASIPELWIFEPNPEAMKVCQQVIGSGDTIKYFPMALGDTNGEITLHVTSSSDLASVLEPQHSFLESTYGHGANVSHIAHDRRVELRTLDSLVPESKTVDLLKIDVQGFERAVLAGAQRVLANTRVVLIEANFQSHYVGDEDLGSLWQLLKEHGFSFWNMSTPHRGADGRLLYADAVFIKSDS